LDSRVHKNADGHAHAVSPCLHANMKKKWGVVQLVGHLTVNEDGEGSNPSAPAKFAFLNESEGGRSHILADAGVSVQRYGVALSE
jgi:hypothetical protein